MKIVLPKFEEIDKSNSLEQGEVCARVCYKSENLIKEGSAKRLLTAIASAGHTAMLEHVPVYVFVPHFDKFITDIAVEQLLGKPKRWEKYSVVNEDIHFNRYISTNLRVIFEHNKKVFDAFMEHDGEPFNYELFDSSQTIRFCAFNEYPEQFVKRITIKFTMDRVGSQSFCRHRVFSFAQETTRFVNYIKEKFGSEISIIQPCWLKPEDQQEFEEDMKLYEQLYFKWINKGYKAEEARAFLPFAVKTEIIMTGFPSAWKHFFSLRNESHAHSQAQELAKPLEEYFKEKGYLS